MVMPKVGGTEVMRAVQGEDPNIPVVFISGYNLVLVVHEAESIENIILFGMALSF